MKIAEAVPGGYYRVKVSSGADSTRELHLGVGWSTIKQTEPASGTLVAALPGEAPSEVEAIRGAGKVLPVTWEGSDRPGPGDRRFLTIRISGVRHRRPRVAYLTAHRTGARLSPVDIEDLTETLRRRCALDHDRAQTVRWQEWPGAEATLADERGTPIQPWNATDFGRPVGGPVELVKVQWRTDPARCLVRGADGGERWVDPFDLIPDPGGRRLASWRQAQVETTAGDQLDAARSLLDGLAPDENRGRGGVRATGDGVFLPWSVVRAVFLDGHAEALAAVAALAEAALHIESAASGLAG